MPQPNELFPTCALFLWLNSLFSASRILHQVLTFSVHALAASFPSLRLLFFCLRQVFNVPLLSVLLTVYAFLLFPLPALSTFLLFRLPAVSTFSQIQAAFLLLVLTFCQAG